MARAAAHGYVGTFEPLPRGNRIMADGFARARNLLLGAVDTVLSLADQERAQGTALQNSSSSHSQSGSGNLQLSRRSTQESSSSSQLSRRSTQEPGSSLQFSTRQTQSASIDEHRRLFGYRPPKGKTPFAGKKGNRGRRKTGSSTWKKDCICLRDKQQSWKPSSEEKIELARMGLGLSQAVFNTDGDAEHIHDVLLKNFPVLESWGLHTSASCREFPQHGGDRRARQWDDGFVP